MSEPFSPSKAPIGDQVPFTVEHLDAANLLVTLRPIPIGDSFLGHPRSFEWITGFSGLATIDLGKIPVINSIFAGWLVGLVRAAHPSRIRLINCTPLVREILGVLRLDMLVEIRP